MKSSIMILAVFLMMRFMVNGQAGSSCATPIAVPLDGICRDYTVSSSTGANLICTSSGTTPITYFSVTTNNAAEDLELNITGPGGQPVEVAMYGGTACNNGNFEPGSSTCFYDGTGIWAPAENFNLTPNTTYILRIKTGTTGSIQICGRSYTPPNDDCFGAKPIGPLLVNDNNACHKPGPALPPGQLCAPVLQNTAFYYYTVEMTGVSGISFENTACDNNYGSNGQANGYQFGIFTGTCSTLNYINCYVGAAANAQLNTGILNAGTRVYVAINGVMGSNCSYAVRGINAMVLSADLKYFTAWKTPEANMLKWVSLREFDNKSFEVQRSLDGAGFSTIGNVAGQINSNAEKNYEFSDADAPEHCFYRLKLNSTNGKYSYSNIIEVNRADFPQINIKFNNPVSQLMNMTLTSSARQDIFLSVSNSSGQVVFRDKISCIKGVNNWSEDFSFLPDGRYNLTAAMGRGAVITRTFLKLGKY